jgi:hypothetical protein
VRHLFATSLCNTNLFGPRQLWAFSIYIGVRVVLHVILLLSHECIQLANHSRVSPLNSSALFLPLPSDSQIFTGDLTYYSPGLGACGVVSTDNDSIVAISHFLFDAEADGTNPNNNPLCGKMIRAERFDEQVQANRSADLTVVDRCRYMVELLW